MSNIGRAFRSLDITEKPAKDSNRDSRLHFAVKEDNVDLVTRLINAGEKIDWRNIDYDTPLHLAAKRNLVSVASILIERGAGVNLKNFSGNIPLHYAIEQMNIELVKKLIDKGADINEKNEFGEPPLFQALRIGFKSGFNLIVDRGAEVNNRDEDGDFAIHCALKCKDKEAVEKLVAHGSDITSKDRYGHTALHTAVRMWAKEDFDCRSIVNLFVDKGADLKATDNDGRMPAQLAVTADNNPIFQIIMNMNMCGITRYIAPGYATEILYDKNLIFPSDENGKPTLGKVIEGTNILFLALTERHAVNKSTRLYFDESQFPNLSRYKSFEEMCRGELRTMKVMKFGKNSMYDVFLKHRDPRFLSNERLVRTIKSPFLIFKFPIYGNILTVMFVKHRQRLALLDLSEPIFTKATNLHNFLPIEIIRMILSYLNNKDLLNLINNANN